MSVCETSDKRKSLPIGITEVVTWSPSEPRPLAEISPKSG